MKPAYVGLSLAVCSLPFQLEFPSLSLSSCCCLRGSFSSWGCFQSST